MILSRRARQEEGFTLVELVVVCMIIGILVAMAVPIFMSAQVQAATRTCFANQRELEGAVHIWRATFPSRDIATLAGVVDAAHPLVIENFIGRPPTCPAGEQPADPSNPTPAEGAYTFDAEGSIAPCPLGTMGPHGHY